jgi:hypothetical protein
MPDFVIWIAVGAALLLGLWLIWPRRPRDTLEVGAPTTSAPLRAPPLRGSAASPAPPVRAEELEKLWRLHQEGALSAGEFEVQKQRLLEGGAAVGGGSLVLVAPGRNKIQVIKRVREMNALGLKEALDLVDAAPTVLAEGLTAEQAEEWRRRFESDGAIVEIR